MSFEHNMSPIQPYNPSWEGFMGIPVQYGMIQEQATAFQERLEDTHRLYAIDTGGGINLERLISTKGAEACLILNFPHKFMLMAQVKSSGEEGYVHIKEPIDPDNRYSQENRLLRWNYNDFLKGGERLSGSSYRSYIDYIRRQFELLAPTRLVTSRQRDQLQNKTAQYKPELWCGEVLVHDGRPIANIHLMGLAVPRKIFHRLLPDTFLPEANILMERHTGSV